LSTHNHPANSHLLFTELRNFGHRATSYGGHATLRVSKLLQRMVTIVLDWGLLWAAGQLHVEVLESLLDSDGHSNTGLFSIKDACL
jgi:hypothetical protein